MVVVAVASVWLLLGFKVDPGGLDAIRTGGTLGVGLGGIVVLWLAVRKQRSTELDLVQKYEAYLLAERAAAHSEAVAERTAQHDEQVAADDRDHQQRVLDASERDAIARRITDLYSKAIDQLGSEKASVRLGGLYALERLAQNNPDFQLRRTVVNMICAYLRMPYAEPKSALGVSRPLRSHVVPLSRSVLSTHRLNSVSPDRNAGADSARQELEVRLTAQRIISAHLKPGSDPREPLGTFWSGIELDFSGATLIDLDLSECHIDAVTFEATIFKGKTKFSKSTFIGNVQFDGATFVESVTFDGVHFGRRIWFRGGRFADRVSFRNTCFDGGVNFLESSFAGDVHFSKIDFSDDASFLNARFAEDVLFNDVTFRGAYFDGASFSKSLLLNNVNIEAYAWFSKCRFKGSVLFRDVTLPDQVKVKEAEFAIGIPRELASFVANPL
ncbi:pentapeptide repeat-containing protein [Amycolatopsis sp. lyj-112]|uniref:pentapeptide repeat-containing protein n=1 Tax=Amycolatopsis sp. lyj-112 TaxID=2789288 RepID=UPI00397D06CC